MAMHVSVRPMAASSTPDSASLVVANALYAALRTEIDDKQRAALVKSILTTSQGAATVLTEVAVPGEWVHRPSCVWVWVEGGSYSVELSEKSVIVDVAWSL